MEKGESLEKLRKLFPKLSEEELEAAQDRIDRYLLLVVSIYEGIREEPKAYAKLRALLEEERRKKERQR